MRNTDLRIDEMLDRGFTQHSEPSHEQMAADLARIRERLDPAVARLGLSTGLVQTRSGRGRVLALAAAVLVVAAAVGTAILWRPVDSALYRIVEGDVGVGDTIRSDSGGGAVLELADSSRIEMRSHSELSLERANDGLRIRLNAGGIIVNAAKQRNGHLYVQTKDITVSVVGTVFLVNAEEQGSRVAVIEGEVRVQQGATEKKLRAGDQLATSPLMESPSVKDAISWSRSAETHVAQLQQSVATETFEVVSVRPAGAPMPGARGGGPPRTCGLNGPPQIDPRRFAIRGASLYLLIGWAYGLSDGLGSLGCETVLRLNLVAGGQDWVRSERFDVEAVIPEGTPVFSEAQLIRGEAVSLQKMLRTLLADRFKLALHVESQEKSVYVMKLVGDASRYKSSEGVSPWLTEKPKDWYLEGRQAYVVPQIGPRDPAMVVWKGSLSGAEASLTDVARLLARLTGQPVVNRTTTTGQFNFHFEFPAESPPNNTPVGEVLNSADRASLFGALERELGLKLEAARAQVEILVIDRAERPTEN